ncbi:MAG: hypothetical protein U0X20_06150 [Caldilineaceae bacterium]
MLLPLLETDLIEVLLACVEGAARPDTRALEAEAAVTVVMAAQGYPDEYPTGHDITGIGAPTPAAPSTWPAPGAKSSACPPAGACSP